MKDRTEYLFSSKKVNWLYNNFLGFPSFLSGSAHVIEIFANIVNSLLKKIQLEAWHFPVMSSSLSTLRLKWVCKITTERKTFSS